MKVELFDYHLPRELIAQKPIEPRDKSRLMVLDRRTGKIEHRRFYNIVEYLIPGDLLVLNNTKVIPARLIGRKVTGAKVEILLLNEVEDGKWRVMVKPGRKLRIGTRVLFDGMEAVIIDRLRDGTRVVEFSERGEKFWNTINKIGMIPLPPYITEDLKDEDRYQTVYAKESGAVASPTAGLHFTHELLGKLRSKGIRIAEITLHVGIGTFRPITVEEVENHVMDREWCKVPKETVKMIEETKSSGGRIVAVGTTVVRTLETMARRKKMEEYSGWTDLFIYPPFEFKLVDILVTNFHLPRSTLLLLVSAFAGREFIMMAYEEAVKRRYRFFSFGDAMLIL